MIKYCAAKLVARRLDSGNPWFAGLEADRRRGRVRPPDQQVRLGRAADAPHADSTFDQVSVNQPLGRRDMNRGNISSAVGPHAIEQGFIETRGDRTTERVDASDFDQMIDIKARTRNGKPEVLGSRKIFGVSGAG